MNPISLEIGRWVYLVIYLFIPVITLVYLIRRFGLKVQEKPLMAARRHIQQAAYWIDVARQSAGAPTSAKSLASLQHTIDHNLERAWALLAENGTDDADDEVNTLLNAYRETEKQLSQLRR